MKRRTAFLALCVTVFFAVIGPSGCSRDRQESAGETPTDEFDRYVEAGYHPALVRMYMKARDGHTFRSDDGLSVRTIGGATLGPDGSLLLEDMRFETFRKGTVPPSTTPEVVASMTVKTARCVVVEDVIQMKLFDVVGEIGGMVGMQAESTMIIDLAEFDHE